MLIREDNHGPYIRSRWYSHDRTAPAYRPGNFPGHSHTWNTTDAGLKAGDKPKTKHVAGSPFVRIILADGSEAYWGSYGRHEGDYAEGGNA